METTLTLEAAKQCLGFTKIIVDRGNEVEKDELVTPEVITALQDFRDYLVLTTNAEIKEIKIPKRYELIHNCLRDTALLFSFGPLGEMIGQMIVDLEIQRRNES